MGQVDVAGPLRTAIEAVRPLADEKGVKIGADILDQGTTVWADSTRLQQIFLNLISNAVKFTERGGRVTVSTRRVDGTAEVEVSDNGIGITPDALPHIFERFRQGDSSTTRRHAGLGLGLAIVKHLAALHGGSVEAKSRGTNQGATFTVRLPYHPLQERRQARIGALRREVSPIVPNPTVTRSLCGLRLLVVDDQSDTRELTASVLTASGAQVRTATSARDALQQLEAETPDAMLVDIAMPDMDGYAFVRAVRSGQNEAAQIPAIAFTAYARQEDRQLALTSGFQMHLPKPVEPGALVMAVASLLEH